MSSESLAGALKKVVHAMFPQLGDSFGTLGDPRSPLGTPQDPLGVKRDPLGSAMQGYRDAVLKSRPTAKQTGGGLKKKGGKKK